VIGSEQRFDPSLSIAERLYIRLLGYPALGLHIRAHAIVPLIRRLQDPRTILDAGCGTGAFSFVISRLFPNARVTAVDADAGLIRANTRIAQQANAAGIQFAAADLTAMTEENAFDAIVCTDMLEHVQDDQLLLRLFYRALRKGGSLIIHTPHLTRNIFGWKRPNFMGIEGHVRPGYRKRDLEELLEKTGFSIAHSCYNYNSLETLLNDLSYLITGGRKQRKHLYAVAFPFLLIATKMVHWWPVGEGSGLVMVAKKG